MTRRGTRQDPSTPPPDSSGGGVVVRPEAWPFVLLALALLVVGVGSWRPVPGGVWHDDGVYLMVGRALAQGAGLTYDGVVGSPPAVKFPPAYPAVLAGLWAVFGGVGRVTLVAVFLNLGLVAAAGGLFAWSLRRHGGTSTVVALTVAGLAFASSDVWRTALVPLSEPLFLLLVSAALVLWGHADPGPPKRRMALAGVLAILVLTRTAGVAVLAGLAVSAGVRRSERGRLPTLLPALAAAALWGAYAAHRARDVPAAMADVLGPYGGWLGKQVLGSPFAFAAGLPSHAAAVGERVLALSLPGLEGGWLWVAGVPLAAFGALGARRLLRTFPAVPCVAAAYSALLLLWPYADRRLVVPLHPLVVALALTGAATFAERRPVTSWLRSAGLVLAVTWVGAAGLVQVRRVVEGWAVGPYRLRAERLATGVEALRRTAEPGAVVAAAELWAALNLHGGWTAVPAARFRIRSDEVDHPIWGSPEEQIATWWGGRVDRLLLEQGGRIHGSALNLLEERCPGTSYVLARMPPQMVVGLEWNQACVERLLATVAR